MNKFKFVKYWIRRNFPPLYYWGIVVWESIKELPKFGLLRDKIRDAWVTLLAWITLSLLVTYGFITSQYAQSIGISSDFRPYGVFVIVLISIKFFQNVFSVPARLYFDARSSLGIADFVDVRKEGIPNKKASLGYGITLINDSSVDLNNVIIQMPYFDIDDIRYEQTEWFGFSQRPDSHISRLTWQYNDNSLQATEKYIERDGGTATAYLFDVEQRNNGDKEFFLRHNSLSETSGRFVEKTKKINNRASGMLIIHRGGSDNKFYFEIFIEDKKNVTMEFDNKPISNYKPSKTEII